ncbi:MAG: bacteriohemerythrin [Planctomycetota bacterium]|nr:bacteriohemerythrin [Planctomycetota bacterium]
MFVRWYQKYSVEDETLDAQHKRLFEIMNSLYSDTRTCHLSRSELRDVIESLVQYGDTHFRAEEAAMRACGYPDLIGHAAEHRRYRHEVQRLTYALTIDEKNSLDKLGDFPHDLRNFLKAWWTKHIAHMDRDYIPFLPHRK